MGQFVFGRLADTEFNPLRTLVMGHISVCLLILAFVGAATASWQASVVGSVGLVGLRSIEGLLQATGWPSTVGIVGNWFEASSRGRVFGAWSSCTNIGDIAGLLFVSATIMIKNVIEKIVFIKIIDDNM